MNNRQGEGLWVLLVCFSRWRQNTEHRFIKESISLFCITTILLDDLLIVL